MEAAKVFDNDYWPINARVRPAESVTALCAGSAMQHVLIVDVGRKSKWIEDGSMMRIWKKEDAGEVCVYACIYARMGRICLFFFTFILLVHTGYFYCRSGFLEYRYRIESGI